MTNKTAIDAKALAEARRAALDAFMDEGAGHDVVLAAITTYLETLWQPIEGAPKDGRLILVATDIKHRVGTPAWTGMYCAYWDDQDDLWKFHREGHVPSPTHWQPLPALPVAASEPRP